MTGRIEKTVFISYRRTNKPWALFIYQNLTNHGYDVFIDFQNINSGNFETAILDNIRARAHFVVVLTPSALENCKNKGDWLRREIETAMDERRNIVPLMVEGFDFGSPIVKSALTGKLAALSQTNGLRIPDDYPFEAMDRLRERYLNVALSNVALPTLTEEAQVIAKAEKSAANEAAPVKEEQLTAQTWFERGYVFQKDKNIDEAIRCFTEAIHLSPKFAGAYWMRGDALERKGKLDEAIANYDEAIQLRSSDNEAHRFYGFRGLARYKKENLDDAISDFNESIKTDPSDAHVYVFRAKMLQQLDDFNGAVADYNEAIRLKPDYVGAYLDRATVLEKKKDYPSAIADYQKYLELDGGQRYGDQKEVEDKIKQLKSKLTKKKSVKKKAK
jgi:tetratricopeptide (TPR) repeat protein